jgi:hypothetical protein
LRRHSGSSGLQSVVFVAVHSLQEPARRPEVRQNGRSGLGQLGAPSLVQATQVWLVEAQSGVIPPQSPAARHPTHTPTPDEVSQRGFVAAQWVVSVAVQAAQAPLGRQIGASAPQSASPPHARQVWLPESQTGVVPLHWAFDRQATQVPTAVLQTGVAPLQRLALLAEQTPQAPPGWQAGSAPPHSSSPAQPRQACVEESHTGTLVLPQSASTRQATQVPDATSQIGVAPVQAVALVPEHWPQAPDV